MGGNYMSLDEIDDADVREEYERISEENKRIFVPYPKKRDENGAVIRK